MKKVFIPISVFALLIAVFSLSQSSVTVVSASGGSLSNIQLPFYNLSINPVTGEGFICSAYNGSFSTCDGGSILFGNNASGSLNISSPPESGSSLGLNTNGSFSIYNAQNDSGMTLDNNGNTLFQTSGGTFGIDGGVGSPNTVVCWKSDGISLGYATVAEITAGTCH
jgi:hypothetical protein